MLLPFRSRTFSKICVHLGALCGALLISVLAACTTAAPPENNAYMARPGATAPHQLAGDRPEYYTLPNLAPNRTPVRIGLILPFSAKSASVRALAEGLNNAAEMAVYDAGNKNILLLSADSHGTRVGAATAARKLIAEGAEVIAGPLFSSSVAAVAPVARDHGVPVIAFSTNRKVAGPGVYLMSFQPENEIRRIVSYARSHGHGKFSALIPQSAYGRVAEAAFRHDVTATGGQIADVTHFNPASGQINQQARQVARSGAGAIFLPQAGSVLDTMTSVLSFNGAGPDKVKYLGTGLWNQPATRRNSLLQNAWFAAPPPAMREEFNQSYEATFGKRAPTLASLSYDAVSLVALLAHGTPYQRFTEAALSDPNGFTGVSGLFRFMPDGTIERGLAVMAVAPDGFKIVSPAPKSFSAAKPRS